MPMTRMESFLENLGDGNAKKGLEKLKADLGYETIIILSDYRLIKIRISKFKILFTSRGVEWILERLYYIIMKRKVLL